MHQILRDTVDLHLFDSVIDPDPVNIVNDIVSDLEICEVVDLAGVGRTAASPLFFRSEEIRLVQINDLLAFQLEAFRDLPDRKSDAGLRIRRIL